MLALAGRVLIAALFVTSGIWGSTHFAGTAAYFSKVEFPVGTPSPEVMAGIAILIEFAGGMLLLVGWRTRWVAWLLVLFVAIATVLGHRFWQVDAAEFFNQMNHFLKNLALIGGLLYIATFGAGRYSIDKA